MFFYFHGDCTLYYFLSTKKNYKNQTMLISFEYNSKWTLKDFSPNLIARNTLSISGGNGKGFITVMCDTSSLELGEYFKKNVEPSYLNNDDPYMPNFKNGTTVINGLVAKYAESTDEKNDNFTAHYLIKNSRNNRLHLLFISVGLKYKAEALVTINSFKGN